MKKILFLLPFLLLAGCGSSGMNDHLECQQMLDTMNLEDRLGGSYTYKMAFYSKQYEECFYAYSWVSDDGSIQTYGLSSFSSPKLVSIMQAGDTVFMMDEYKEIQEYRDKSEKGGGYETWLDVIDEYKK